MSLLEKPKKPNIRAYAYYTLFGNLLRI